MAAAATPVAQVIIGSIGGGLFGGIRFSRPARDGRAGSARSGVQREAVWEPASQRPMAARPSPQLACCLLLVSRAPELTAPGARPFTGRPARGGNALALSGHASTASPGLVSASSAVPRRLRHSGSARCRPMGEPFAAGRDPSSLDRFSRVIRRRSQLSWRAGARSLWFRSMELIRYGARAMGRCCRASSRWWRCCWLLPGLIATGWYRSSARTAALPFGD